MVSVYYENINVADIPSGVAYIAPYDLRSDSVLPTTIYEWDIKFQSTEDTSLRNTSSSTIQDLVDILVANNISCVVVVSHGPFGTTGATWWEETATLASGSRISDLVINIIDLTQNAQTPTIYYERLLWDNVIAHITNTATITDSETKGFTNIVVGLRDFMRLHFSAAEEEIIMDALNLRLEIENVTRMTCSHLREYKCFVERLYPYLRVDEDTIPANVAYIAPNDLKRGSSATNYCWRTKYTNTEVDCLPDGDGNPTTATIALLNTELENNNIEKAVITSFDTYKYFNYGFLEQFSDLVLNLLEIYSTLTMDVCIDTLLFINVIQHLSNFPTDDSISVSNLNTKGFNGDVCAFIEWINMHLSTADAATIKNIFTTRRDFLNPSDRTIDDFNNFESDRLTIQNNCIRNCFDFHSDGTITGDNYDLLYLFAQIYTGYNNYQIGDTQLCTCATVEMDPTEINQIRNNFDPCSFLNGNFDSDLLIRHAILGQDISNHYFSIL